VRTACLIFIAAILAVPAASARQSGSGLSPKVGFNDSPLDWSADGRIAFGHTRQPPETSIWAPTFDIDVMRADGSGKRVLAPRVRRDTEEWDFVARWSPDGSLATFVRVHGAEFENSTLYVVRADGTGLRALTDRAPGDGAGIWSPDGQTIAFGRFSQAPSQSSGIWLVRPDGTGLRQLTQGEDYGPVWSPDGRSIAFNRLGPRRTETAIFTVGVAGGAPRQLTAFGHASVNQWSADGALLMYETPGGSSGIRTMRPDGSERRKLVDGFGGVWSPDGRRLLFARERGTPRGGRREDVYVAEASGRNARQVFAGAHYGIWSRDGKRLAVPSPGPCNGLGVYVIRVATRIARRISNDCRVLGTRRADRLLGTRERDLIWGLGGNDFIDATPGNRKVLWAPRLDHNFVDGGAGNDRILGRLGQDILIGGPGRDSVSGGGQDDRILVVDGEVDVVRCGWGNADTVFADRFDVVAADCERVRRR
jgi:Tol biopolymer transport system component